MSYFKFDPSVIFQLGESLITDEFQALEELIKNSYDADATLCEIEIGLDDNPPPPSAFPNAKGYLLVRDNGSGMNVSDIETKWLTISFSEKREMKGDEKTTKKRRTPLGDKGLGRLGVQRLGENVDLWSRKENGENGATQYSWRDFRKTEETVEKIKIDVTELPVGAARHLHKKGTQIIISDLKIRRENLRSWALAIQSKVSEIISPFEEINEFDITITVNGKSQPLIKVDEQAREAAQVKYTIEFDGRKLAIRAQMKASFMKPYRAGDEALDAYSSLIEEDRARKFVSWLSQNEPVARDHNVKHISKGHWPIEFSLDLDLDDVPGVQKLRAQAHNPGTFRGEVYYYQIADAREAFKAAFGAGAEFNKAFKELSGVKIYRDGFQIRMPADWLGLGEAATFGESFYGLRPANTLGYVQLSAKENAQLEEVTDREGFKATPPYESFIAMMSAFVKFTSVIQESARRGYLEYRDQNVNKTEDVPAKASVKEIARAIERNVTDASSRVGDKTALESMRKNAAHLAHQAERIEERQADIIHLASLGITAEALTHEMLNILDRILDDITALEKEMKRENTKSLAVDRFTTNLRTNLQTMRKQVSYLSPALKYVREQRQTFQLDEMVNEFAEFWRYRVKDTNIELKVSTRRAPKIRMNKGRLQQVLDNILLNSQYWVTKHLEDGKIQSGVISVHVNGSTISIEDNGPGVHKSVENSLFEPFVSRKEKGRGLGLYVVRELLEANDCAISLHPRQADSKLGRFEIDLEAVAVE